MNEPADLRPDRTVWGRGLGRLRRHSRLILAAVAALSLGAAVLVTRLRINPDVNSLIQREDPTLRLTRHLLRESPLSRTLLLVLRADRPEQLEAVMPSLVDRLRASPHLQRVIATREEFLGPRFEWMRQAPLYWLPPETLDQLRERLVGRGRREELALGGQRMAEDPLAGKETFLRDPLGLRWIFDKAGDSLGNRFPVPLQSGTPYLVFGTSPPLAFLRAVGSEDSFNLPFTRGLMEDVETRLRESLGSGPVRAELAGGYVTATAQAATMRRDIELQFLSTIVGVFLFLVVFLRSWTLPSFVFLPVGLAILWGLAYGSALWGPLTPIAMSMTAIVAGLGTDYPIYLLTRFTMERETSDRPQAIDRTLAFLGRPVIGASTTSMAGFLVLLASQFPGLRQFGLVTFLGFTLAVVLSILLFPALGFWIDRLKPVRIAATPWIVRGARWFAGTRSCRPMAIGILALGIASWLGVFWGSIPVDLDLRRTLSSDDPGQKVLERLEGSLGISMSPVFALVDRSVSPEGLRGQIRALEANGAVVHSDGVQELVPSSAAVERVARFRQEIHGWADATLGDLEALGYRRDRFRKGLEEVDRLFDAPPPVLGDLDRPLFSDLRQTMTYEEGGRRFWVVYLWPKRSLWNPADRARWNDAVRPILAGDVPSRPDPTRPAGVLARDVDAVRLVSAFHAPDYQASTIRRDLSLIGGLAVGAIVVLTVLCLGRLVDGLLALLPVLVATGITLAACTLLGGTIKSMNLAAIPILMGMGVDGGIYFVACLRARGWRNPAGAIDDMGRGYWGATATTILGFGSIATSSTPGLSFLGVLVIVGMTSCLVTTFFMLPGLVRPARS
ncbi:MAG TPA: MMPL family transporter [Planctomycetota bacterium]|nr:MMPL family transporter [Planctomycetota bacterium]